MPSKNETTTQKERGQDVKKEAYESIGIQVDRLRVCNGLPLK